MKTGTTSLLKFKKLRRRLKLSLWETIGVLEALWQVAFSNTPCGDIGKLSNEDIAAAMEWEGDPDDLVEVLVETGWLDADHEFRLIVHDWSHHVPNFVKGNIEKHRKAFADVVARTRSAASPGENREEPPLGSVLLAPSHQTNPNQSKQNQLKPNKTNGEVGVGIYKNSITEADLKDTAKVLAHVPVSAPEADKLRVIAAAERALEVADNPGGMFLSIIKGANWKLISNEQEDRARRRLAKHNARAGPAAASLVANAFKLPEEPP